MRKALEISVLNLILVATLFYSCQKEDIKVNVQPQSLATNQALQIPDSNEVYKVTLDFKNPNSGVVSEYDLRLIPTLAFEARMNELLSQLDTSQLIEEFTGILRAYQDSIENFSAYYEQGSFKQTLVFTLEEEPRVPPICPEPHFVVYTFIEITDWWQVGGDGTVKFLGSSTETTTEVVEMCTPGFFDQYYTDISTYSINLNVAQAKAWKFDRIFEMLLDENISLFNPCKPDNSQADNIREIIDYLEESDIDFSTDAFLTGYLTALVQCDEGAEYVTTLDGGYLHNKTCKGSFNYIPVGDGYTAQVSDILHGYKTIDNDFFIYHIGVMCIQVSGTDAFGQPLTPQKAAELSAFAMDNARLELFDEMGQTIHTNAEAKAAYKGYIVDELIKLTGAGTSSSVSFGVCQGNIPDEPYKVNPYGLALCVNWW